MLLCSCINGSSVNAQYGGKTGDDVVDGASNEAGRELKVFSSMLR